MPDGHFEPTRILKVPGGGYTAWAVALVAAMGVLVGVLLVVLLGGGGGSGGEGATAQVARTTTVVQRVTVPQPITTPGEAVVTTTVPGVIGERLDVAKERLEAAGFDTDARGGGTFGIVVDSNWVVVAQSPQPTERRQVGSLVTLDVEKR